MKNPQVDRSRWRPGPWDEEPDLAHWITAAGPAALAFRVVPAAGFWCGFVACGSMQLPGFDIGVIGALIRTREPLFTSGSVSFEHNRHCLTHVALALRVHGGPPDWIVRAVDMVDSAARRMSLPLHSADTFVGFACARVGDGWPDSRPWQGRPQGIYRTLAYVKAECEALAAQLHTIRAPSGRLPGDECGQ